MVKHASTTVTHFLLEIELIPFSAQKGLDDASYARDPSWKSLDESLSSRTELTEVSIVFKTSYAEGKDTWSIWSSFPVAFEVMKEQLPQLMSKRILTFGLSYLYVELSLD